jgi:hypothetical protein
LTVDRAFRYSSWVLAIPGDGYSEESEMKLRRERGAVIAFAAIVALMPACRKKPVEINPITPSFSVNRQRAPLGSAVEVTYTWALDQNAKKVGDYRALVHFLDPHKTVLFTDDHVPTPPPSSWEPGKTYTYKRTVFIPVYPYVGPVRVAMGLYATGGKAGRIALKGEDLGLEAYKVGTMDLLPKQDNLTLIFKEGWYTPETRPDTPQIEMQWSKKDAVVSFRNPKKDVVLYLEGDTCFKCFPTPPSLTVHVGGKTGITVPIENADLFLKKIRFKAQDLGKDDYVDVHLTMSESFVPKSLGMNDDVRDLALTVYHLFVAEADALGNPEEVVDAGPVTLPAETKTASAAAAKGKPSPAPAKAPAKAPVKSPAPPAKKS